MDVPGVRSQSPRASVHTQLLHHRPPLPRPLPPRPLPRCLRDLVRTHRLCDRDHGVRNPPPRTTTQHVCALVVWNVEVQCDPRTPRQHVVSICKYKRILKLERTEGFPTVTVKLEEDAEAAGAKNWRIAAELLSGSRPSAFQVFLRTRLAPARRSAEVDGRRGAKVGD